MNDICYYLDEYPLGLHYSTCESFLHTTLNWDEISKKISEEGVIHFDVSDVISLFPHLELDENYRLICFLSREYHGIWGRIAAIKKGDSCEPVIDPDDKWAQLFKGHSFSLPEGAAPPMEAIYNDGTPYGYFETLLAEEFIGAIPYTCFEQKNWDFCIMDYPERFPEDWNVYERVTDLRPHMITTPHGVIISMYWHHPENGIGSSSGCDDIRLAQHEFWTLSWYHAAASLSKKQTMYKAQIKDYQRYREGRHCCVSKERAITIAVQKDWRTLSKHKGRK